MYAIVETGGKQYKLEEGRYVDIELLDNNVNDKVTFDKVVMLVNGKKSKVGTPYVDSATVKSMQKLQKKLHLIQMKQEKNNGT